MTQAISSDMSSVAANMRSVEQRAVSKIGWKLVPLIVCMYLFASLDRANVSFAALTMNKDLDISPLIYGWGSGIYFIGSFVTGIPCGLLYERYGARSVLATIAVIWGIVAAGQSLISGSYSFLGMRLLLGVAEAGLFPIVVLYIGEWFPSAYRARVMALFLLSNPLSTAIGGVLAGPLLLLDGTAGLHGWQWMFIVEALPAFMLCFVLLRFLPNTPSEAAWLKSDERDWLISKTSQTSSSTSEEQIPIWRILVDRTVLLFLVIYFSRMMSLFGVTFFLPLIFKNLGLSNAATGYISAIPFSLAAIGMLVWAHFSDRAKDRRRHLLATHLVTAIGLIAAAYLGASYWSIAAMSVASLGFSAQAGVFWALPSMTMRPAVTAVAVAWINGVGSLGAIVGPSAVGFIKQETGSYTIGLVLLAVCVGAAGLLAIVLPRTNETKAMTA
jgi:MFS transporter, ACS family, tartrate transporter